VVSNGLAGIKKNPVGEVCLYLQLELNTLGILSVPTGKNLKALSQHVVRLYLVKLSVVGHIWKFSLVFGVGNSLLKF